MTSANKNNIVNKINIEAPHFIAKSEQEKQAGSSPKNDLKSATSLHSIFVAIRKMEQKITETSYFGEQRPHLKT